MKITPLDIRQKTFEKNFRGYDKDEVDAYLLSLSKEWEKQQDELRELKIRLELAEKEVNKLREVESSLYKTLKTAEDTGANLVDQARRQAELMKEEASLAAKQMVQDAERQARQIWEEVKAELRETESLVKEIENHKTHLYQELKHLAEDTLGKAERLKKSTQSDDLKAILKKEFQPVKTQGKDAKVKVDSDIDAPRKEKVAEASTQIISEPETDSNVKSSKSFFDEIA
jgi:cell division initiation protein